MDAVKHEIRRSSSSAASTSSLQDGCTTATQHRSSSHTGAKKERVWVGVRIRPLLEQELLSREQPAWKAVSSNTLQYMDPERPAGQQAVNYQYDCVFPESSSSEAVYTDAARGLLAAAVCGYNGTIFAYGQTGSGKTYTMQAIMACAAQDVFSLIAQNSSREFIIRLAALEIYNENVRDLLQDKSPSVKLLDDPVRGTVADGLSEAGVSSEQHLQQLLKEVAARRQVGGLHASGTAYRQCSCFCCSQAQAAAAARRLRARPTHPLPLLLRTLARALLPLRVRHKSVCKTPYIPSPNAATQHPSPPPF